MRSASSFIRRAGAAVAAVGIAAAAGLVAAPSASAANVATYTVSCTSGAIAIATLPNPMDIGDTITLQTSDNNCDTVYWGGGFSTPSVTGGTLSGAALTITSAPAVLVFTATSSRVNATSVALNETTFMSAQHGRTVTAPSINAAPTPSDDSAPAPAPVPASMALALGEGAGAAVCTSVPAPGYVGSWMTLPGQGDCSKVGSPNAKLLGWSTSASFPVAIAQRQADNKWGTYELTDADGVVTAIFIPAGWGTVVTGANTLHPIWAQ